MISGDWACPVCGNGRPTPRFRTKTSIGGPQAEGFRPSTGQFGRTLGEIVRCLDCGHGSLGSPPSEAAVMTEYEDAADPVSLREEQGQVESARRALARIERTLAPGRMVDLGSWTGSFLVAAAGRGWDGVGIEPSAWAAAQARGRGVQVFERDLFQHALAPGSFRLAVLCDVLEHLVRPGAGLCTIRDLLEPGGGLYLTIPNAGSFLARLLGRHWWSVLPMHLQYFTPSSLRRLLEAEGFEVAWMRTHAKAFTARYYGERLGGYSPALAAGATRALDLVGLADRMVAPDFRDRLAALAIRR